MDKITIDLRKLIQLFVVGLVALILLGCPLNSPGSSEEIFSDSERSLDASSLSTTDTTPRAILWEHPNFQGKAIVLKASSSGITYGSSYLRSKGLYKKISSVKLLYGIQISVMDSKDRYEMITEDNPDLRSIGWNDNIVSVSEAYPQIFISTPCVLVFEKPDYRGKWSLFFVDEVYPAFPQAVPSDKQISYYMADNAISSIRCYNGARATIYANKNYGGAAFSTADNIANLGDFGFDDTASSISISLDTPPQRSYKYHHYLNSEINDHFYTPWWEELGKGNGFWQHWGVECYLYRTQVTQSTALHLFCNIDTNIHYLTTNKDELLNQPQWKYQGVSAYIFKTQLGGMAPFYHFYNMRTTAHAYSTNSMKYKASADWVNQGIIGYVYPSSYLF